MSTSTEISQILLKVGAVALSPKEPFTFASGIKSPVYCDNRLIMSYPKERQVVVEAFVSAIEAGDFSADVIAGTATAGISWAAWIADRLNKPMAYIRSASKGHGKGNQIEGKIKEGQSVLVIEDLISTGGSSIKAIESVREAGHKVTGCLAIFSYEMVSAIDAFKKAQVSYSTLSCFSDLVDVAVAENRITEDQKAEVLTWNQDPASWGV